MNQVNALHLRALRLAKRYRQMEASLLDVLSKMMELGAFEKLGYANAYQYCTEGLRLSESQGYALVGIARKAKEVPELKTQIEKGAIHLTNARRIVPLLTRENQDTWLEKAATLSQRQLEREIVREFPKLEAPERIRPLSAVRSELRVGISLELEAKLAKIKDLLSRKTGKAEDLEAALNAMADT